MVDYIVFTVKSQADSAVRQIDVKLGLPKVGVNKATGRPAPEKTGTTTWAVPEQRPMDGKWVFPSCPDAEPDRPYTVEPYSDAWWQSPTGATGN